MRVNPTFIALSVSEFRDKPELDFVLSHELATLSVVEKFPKSITFTRIIDNPNVDVINFAMDKIKLTEMQADKTINKHFLGEERFKKLSVKFRTPIGDANREKLVKSFHRLAPKQTNNAQMSAADKIQAAYRERLAGKKNAKVSVPKFIKYDYKDFVNGTFRILSPETRKLLRSSRATNIKIKFPKNIYLCDKNYIVFTNKEIKNERFVKMYNSVQNEVFWTRVALKHLPQEIIWMVIEFVIC